MKTSVAVIATVAILIGTGLSATQQESRRGPVIHSAGATFAVPDPGFETPVDMTYRVVFDVAQGARTATGANPRFDTVARFLNMHARAGVPPQQLQVAMVVHGGAAVALLDNEAHLARTEVDNPNLAILKEFAAAGVRIVLCGQTAAARQIEAAQLVGGVEVALSAMTAMAVLQAEGYTVNPF
jgi:intracellular sulfur oxidation DsrE/DsrF family protein